MKTRNAPWILAAMLLFPGIAGAAEISSLGPRFGFSSDPDQLVLGGQMGIDNIAPDLDFVPNLELGFGDDATVIAANFDFHYRFAIQGSTWSPYLGAGVGVNFIDFNRPGFNDVSDTEVGGNLVLGAQVPTRTGSTFFAEAKFGVGDIPDFKLLGGFNFRY